MDMYTTGEIYEVLNSFEKKLHDYEIYVGCKVERSEQQFVKMPSGKEKKIFVTYYDNGRLNELFKLYLSGYSAGKLEGRLQSS